MTNPNFNLISKYAQQLLGDKYPKYQTILLRASLVLVTKDDVHTFCTMLLETYEEGFYKAVKQQREQLEGMGIKVGVKQETKQVKA